MMELKARLVIEASDAEKELDKVVDKTEEIGEGADEASSRFDTFSKKLGAISPTFEKMSKDWQEKSEKITEAFGENTKVIGLLKTAVVAAVAVIGFKIAQMAHRVASEWARMFDPQAFSKSAGRMERAMRRLKTSLGALVSPLVNGINNIISGILENVNGAIETVAKAVSFLGGLLSSLDLSFLPKSMQVVAEASKDTADNVTTAVEATSAGLAAFDKLNTLDMSGAGDAEQADRMKELMAEWDQKGKDIMAGIAGFFEDIDLGGILDGLGEGLADIGQSVSDFFNGIGIWVGGVWTGFVTWAGQAWDAVVSFGTTAWDTLQQVAGAVWVAVSGFITNVWSGFSMWVTTAWNALAQKAQEVWNAITGFINGVWTGFTTWATTAWNSVTSTAAEVWNGITTTVRSLWQNFTTWGRGAWDDAKSAGGEFISSVLGRIQSIIDGIKSTIETIVNKIKEISQKASNLRESVTSGISNAVSGVVSGAKNLLGLAGGGAIAPNNPAPYILGDNRKEYEIVSPVSLMEDAVMSAISKMGGTATTGSSGPIELTINLDGRKLARQIYDPLQTETRRRGSAS